MGRKTETRRYREYRTAGGWVRWVRAEIRSAGSLPSVRVERTETRLPKGSADRYAVTFTVTGPDAEDYVTRSLPTARIVSREPGCIVAQWSY